MRIYLTTDTSPINPLGLWLRKHALFPTSNKPLVQRHENTEKLLYASNGVYIVDNKKQEVRRMVLHNDDIEHETLQCTQPHSIVLDDSYWKTGDIVYHIPTDYIAVEIKRERYELPNTPSVKCVIESRNKVIRDMFYECSDKVPLTSAWEDIESYLLFFEKHCVKQKS